jgi:hypothetical protein
MDERRKDATFRFIIESILDNGGVAYILEGDVDSLCLTPKFTVVFFTHKSKESDYLSVIVAERKCTEDILLQKMLHTLVPTISFKVHKNKLLEVITINRKTDIKNLIYTLPPGSYGIYGGLSTFLICNLDFLENKND